MEASTFIPQMKKHGQKLQFLERKLLVCIMARRLLAFVLIGHPFKMGTFPVNPAASVTEVEFLVFAEDKRRDEMPDPFFTYLPKSMIALHAAAGSVSRREFPFDLTKLVFSANRFNKVETSLATSLG
jgi:hypothetical protein